MKRSLGAFSAAFAPLFIVFGLVSCGPFPWNGSAKYYQIPWPTPSGSYEIQRVYIKTFTEPGTLKGVYAQLFIEPFEGPSGLEGQRSVGRFVDNHGTLIPADVSTLQATAVYAHMERLHDFDEAAGLNPALAGVWPARIGLNVNVPQGSSAFRNNAIYDGRLNALLLVPYSDTNLPISANGGVLAHEHFHSIFQQAVLGRLGALLFEEQRPRIDKHDLCAIDESHPPHIKRVTLKAGESKLARPITKLEYNRFLVRGINEGLADFWGWAYTGDTNFIRHSLQNVGTLRALDAPMGALPSLESIQVNIQERTDASDRVNYSYTLGTYYARFLYSLAIRQSSDRSAESRLEIARAVLASLPAIAEAIAPKFESEFIAPDVILVPLIDQLRTVKPESCVLLEEFLSEQTGGSSKAPKPKACQSSSPAVLEGASL